MRLVEDQDLEGDPGELIAEQRLDVGQPQPAEFANPRHLAEGERGSICSGYFGGSAMRRTVGDGYQSDAVDYLPSNRVRWIDSASSTWRSRSREGPPR